MNLTSKDKSFIASELGKLAKGKPKRLTDAERKRRGARLAEARKRRWIKPVLTYRN